MLRCFVEHQVLTVVIMKRSIFWDATPWVVNRCNNCYLLQAGPLFDLAISLYLSVVKSYASLINPITDPNPVSRQTHDNINSEVKVIIMHKKRIYVTHMAILDANKQKRQRIRYRQAIRLIAC